MISQGGLAVANSLLGIRRLCLPGSLGLKTAEAHRKHSPAQVVTCAGRQRSVVAQETNSQDTKGHRDDEEQDSKRQQDGPDHSADATGICKRPPVRIHGPGVHLLEIAAAHSPGEDAERSADDQAEDPEDQNESAAMWFHNGVWVFPNVSKSRAAAAQASNHRTPKRRAPLLSRNSGGWPQCRPDALAARVRHLRR